MASSFILVMDTAYPGGLSITGPALSSQQLVDMVISTSDPVTTSYQFKIWGDVDPTQDVAIQTSEGASSWITYTPVAGSQSKQIKLSNNGVILTPVNKTIYLKFRDDVWNETPVAASTIVALDTSLPVTNITIAATPTKISKVTTSNKDQCSFSWASDTPFTEYKVCVVVDADSQYNTGTNIVNNSTRSAFLSGTGNFQANSNINTIICGTDLANAVGDVDGSYTIKVFVKEEGSNFWST